MHEPWGKNMVKLDFIKIKTFAFLKTLFKMYVKYIAGKHLYPDYKKAQL